LDDEKAVDARRLAISIDGGLVCEFDIFPEVGGLGGGDYDGRMDDLAARIEAAVQALEPANPSLASFAASQANDSTLGRIIMTAGTPAADPERSSVSVTSASRRNAAVILRTGSANGGRETEAAAEIRPAPSGTT